MHCSKCGYELKGDMNFCPKCGTKVLSAVPRGTFTDPRDGKVYRTVEINGQVWMAENLDYAGNSGVYYKDAVYPPFEKAGRLYTCQQAMEAVPSGWHLPSKEEWQELVDFLGGDKIAGKKLKAVSGWDSYKGQDGNGTDEYGFGALPGGGCWYRDFGCVDESGYWWCASKDDDAFGDYCNMSYDKSIYGLEKKCIRRTVKSYLFSVRCVQDKVRCEQVQGTAACQKVENV